ncbi:sigma-70 family RNA polymerase sigma factor [Actinoplanes sp. NEAU-A11]|uniref:Sigma-70 family RNA polymerase sigma factor n=2 Tax=Actinoplanes aureus TaxID=2792083 RepID=A0A931CEY2_9ACTN|nr:sigma-70 family RNA polymerase sigma factor [Actinoplanes aureus]
MLPILVQRAGQGDEDAWTELVRRYNPMLRSIARSLRLTAEEGGLDAEIVRSERDRLLWQAVDDLPAHQRKLMLLLSRGPKPSYQQVAQVMAMPVGSIGPTRARALQRLRDLLTERGVSADTLDPMA